jgi:hypothetical protein
MRAPVRKAPSKTAESWPAAVTRAREAWDTLTGHPSRYTGPDVPYSDAAAAAILDTALRLWSDTARILDS